jgi:hypothetical protein
MCECRRAALSATNALSDRVFPGRLGARMVPVRKFAAARTADAVGAAAGDAGRSGTGCNSVDFNTVWDDCLPITGSASHSDGVPDEIAIS